MDVRLWTTELRCLSVRIRPASRSTVACWLADEIETPHRSASSLVVQADMPTA